MEGVKTAMSIAGSDSGAGAGIQADLKTFAAFGVYGTSALTAITAQNTTGVTAVFDLPLDIISAQIDAIISDIGTDSVKTGMLSNTAIIELVGSKIREHAVNNLVVDPVMVAKGGDRLLAEDAIYALRGVLIPLASVVTPNLPEASALVNRTVETVEEARKAAVDIVNMGAKSVVVKGGHLVGDAIDIFYDGKEFTEFVEKRIETSSTHGTGCTFASSIAAGLALGNSLELSVSNAKIYVTQAIRSAIGIGNGHGPLNHFYHFG